MSELGSMGWVVATLLVINALAFFALWRRQEAYRAAQAELRHLERQLESRIAETSEAVRARDEFLGVASHELRTPLTALRLQIRLAQQASLGGTPPLERLRIIERQAARLEALVNQLLDVTKVASRKLELDYAELDLAEVISDVVDRMQPEVELVSSSLDVAVQGQVRGKWDSLRIEQVLVNLLSNAVKFGPGKPIQLRLEDLGEKAQLTVKDQGIGVSPADQSRIFLPFERATPSRHYGGLGLGLWITARIVEAHGGTIAVKSQPGAGAEFTVLLPKIPPAATRRPGANA